MSRKLFLMPSSRRSQCSAIGTKEQVAKCAPQQIGNPALCEMMRSIVDHVTALAQAPEIALSVVTWIVIEMGRGQDHSGLPLLRRLHEVGPAGVPTAAIAPTMTGNIEPTAIGQAANCHAVRAATSLTNALSTLEPHPPADFAPISCIELPHLRSYRHQSLVVATPVH